MHHNEHPEVANHRSKEYGDAGANGFFVPGLRDARLIEILCKRFQYLYHAMIDYHWDMSFWNSSIKQIVSCFLRILKNEASLCSTAGNALLSTLDPFARVLL